MFSVNKIVLLGTVGNKPSIKKTTKSSFCPFSVATNSQSRDQQGNIKEFTEWHRIITFGKLSETCEKNLNKGSKVYIEGRLQTRKYTDKEDVEKFVTEILADKVIFLDSKPQQKQKFNKKNTQQENPHSKQFEHQELPF